MTFAQALETALGILYLVLFLITLISFARRPTAVGLSVVAVFASIALLYDAGAIGQLWPAAARFSGIASVLGLVALPFFTLVRRILRPALVEEPRVQRRRQPTVLGA